MLCNNHHYLVPEHFYYPRRKPIPMEQSLPIFPSQSLVTTKLLSVFMDLPTVNIWYKRNHILWEILRLGLDNMGNFRYIYICVCVCVYIYIYIYTYICIGVELLGSNGNAIKSLLRNYHSVYSSWIILHSHQQCMKVPNPPHPHPHLLFSIFKKL